MVALQVPVVAEVVEDLAIEKQTVNAQAGRNEISTMRCFFYDLTRDVRTSRATACTFFTDKRTVRSIGWRHKEVNQIKRSTVATSHLTPTSEMIHLERRV